MKKLFILFSLAVLLLSYSCGGGGGGGGSISTSDIQDSASAIELTSVTISIEEVITGTKAVSQQAEGDEIISAGAPSVEADVTETLNNEVVTSGIGDLPVDICRITITGPAMEDIVVMVTIAGKDLLVETIEVPRGINRYILIELLDDEGNILFKADRHGVNIEGQTLTIEIKPEPSSEYLEPPAFAGVDGVENIDSKSLRINWAPAVDELTSHNRIQYLIYISSASINNSEDKGYDFESFYSQRDATLLEAEDPLVNYSYDSNDVLTMVSYDFEARLKPDSDLFTGHLTPGIPYYFIVRAKDEFGNIDTNFQEINVTVHTLDLTIQGAGQVHYDPSETDCGSACSEDFLKGTEVTLTAIPDQGVDFNGWSSSGDVCNGTGPCVFTVEDNVSVTADFCQFKTYYKDKDEDGYGDRLDITDACTPPAGYVDNSTDCDDNNAGMNPASQEIPYDGIDQDCSGSDLHDVDGDGFNSTSVGGTDCDDTNAGINTSAAEIAYDGIDQDCSGADLADVDEDGFNSNAVAGGTDCDDTNAGINTSAAEIAYDGIDQDCSGADLTDVDEDGFNSTAVAGGTDCDDTNAGINPGAAEIAYDGIDQDCSGADLTDVDEDGFNSTSVAGGTDCDDTNPGINTSAVEIAYDGIDQDCSGTDLTDVDEDGFNSTSVAGGTDCDDTNSGINPGVAEIAYDGIDQDCSGSDLTDVDEDGFDSTSVAGGTDCDDNDAGINPGAAEIAYDGIDQNCSGSDLHDVDGDGFNSTAVAGTDCDDTNAGINPGAAEIAYDGIDQDCSGSDLTDVDEDGFDSTSVAGGTDCDDNDAGINPGAAEIAYDGIDQDCSGSDLTDVDEDGFNSTSVAGGTDCDDTNAGINPGAAEIAYDGIDQDCSGSDLTDVDEDGFNSTSVAGGTDCDDTNAGINPGAAEIAYDGIDQDCSGSDLHDVDGDGFNSTAVAGGADCDDTNAGINPGAAEIAYDGIDQDCSGADLTDVDEDGFDSTAVAGGADCDDTNAGINPGAAEIAYDGIDQDCSGADLADVDEDGFDSTAVAGGADCDDTNAGINPGVAEIAYDGIDQDCSGADLADVDEDGFDSTAIAGGTDCDDNNSAVNPGATEQCDNVDNNCDGQIDEDLTRATTCGLGQCAGNAGEETCANGVWGNNTCDPVAGAAGETCDGLDNNCDGQIDEPYIDLGSGCASGLGECMRAGVYVCNEAGTGTECNAAPGTPLSSLDACNGLDDNCDGQVDEGFVLLIGDNDGYGYGSSTAPDGSTLPEAPVSNQYCSGGGSCSGYGDRTSCEADASCDWVDWEFHNRDASESSASNGAQYTDNVSYAPDFFFYMTFPPSDQWRIKTATFILDVSGIQSSLYGSSSIHIDSVDYSSQLSQEQDLFGSRVTNINVSKISVKDGLLPVTYEGGTINGGDAIAFDYFGFTLQCY